MKKPRSSGKTLGVAPLFQIARLANFLTSCSFSLRAHSMVASQ